MKTLSERVQRAVCEDIAIAAYDFRWPELFRREAEHLLSCVPAGLIRCIEHFGSTAVPGLEAKPVIDLLVEVRSLRATRTEIAPILEAQGTTTSGVRALVMTFPRGMPSSLSATSVASVPTTFT